MPSELQKIVSLTNSISLAEHNGHRDMCVLTSHALNDVLHRLGYVSRLVRVEATVFPNDRDLIATILGGLPNGERRKAAAPGKWHGHLAVAVDDAWLLDPTLDQANKAEWPADACVGPMVVQLNEAFWHGRSIMVQVNKSEVRYRLYPKQNGFAYAADARSSRWRPISNAIMGALERERKWKLISVD